MGEKARRPLKEKFGLKIRRVRDREMKKDGGKDANTPHAFPFFTPLLILALTLLILALFSLTHSTSLTVFSFQFFPLFYFESMTKWQV